MVHERPEGQDRGAQVGLRCCSCSNKRRVELADGVQVGVCLIMASDGEGARQGEASASVPGSILLTNKVGII